jgi:hypothetical protein
MGRGRELGLIAPNPAPGGGFFVVVEELRRKKGRGGVREENLAFTPA